VVDPVLSVVLEALAPTGASGGVVTCCCSEVGGSGSARAADGHNTTAAVSAAIATFRLFVCLIGSSVLGGATRREGETRPRVDEPE
jgi:hypothetical protein